MSSLPVLGDDTARSKMAAAAFNEWLASANCATDKVRMVESSASEGNILVSCTTCSAGEPLLRVPRSLTMSRASAERTELGPVLSRHEAKMGAMLPQDEVLAIHLMYERRKSLGQAPGSSFWGPWLSVLPVSYDATPFWSAAELEQLRGTMCFVLTEMMQKQLEQDLCGLVARVHEEGGESLFGAPAFTAEEYHWAMGTVWSRAFGVDDDASGGGGAKYVRMLVPLIDMINHKPGVGYTLADLVALAPSAGATAAAAAEADGGGGAEQPCQATGEVHLLAPPRGVIAGEELSLHYGDYSNAKLLYSYGFALQENPTRSIDMWFGVPPTDLNADLKRALLAAQPATMGGCKFNFDGTLRHSEVALAGDTSERGRAEEQPSVTEPFFAALRVIVMQPDELQTALADIESGKFSTVRTMISVRNEAAVLDLLHAEVSATRARRRLQELHSCLRFSACVADLTSSCPAPSLAWPWWYAQCGRKLGRYATTLDEDKLLLATEAPLSWRHQCAILVRLDEKRLLQALMPRLQQWKVALLADPDTYRATVLTQGR